MPVTKDQAHMLAALARGVQAETIGKACSDEPGIVANLEPVAHMSLAEVMRAVSRWAEDRDAKTPGLLKDTRSSCWRERSEMRATPRNPRPSEMCGDCGKPDGPAHPVDHPFERTRRSECDASTEVAHLRGLIRDDARGNS